MSDSQPSVFISPGASGNPVSPKLLMLVEVARSKGLQVEVFDCVQVPNPERRVSMLLESAAAKCRHPILVGSSMGGYVSAVAAEKLAVTGLFLLSPVLYLPPYENLDPRPKARLVTVVHGLEDEIVPPDKAIRFARKFSGRLHLLPGDHSLKQQLPGIRVLFDSFLNECMHSLNP